MSRQARQKRPVAPWQRAQSDLPMHSAVVLRRLQRGQPSSPHSFFWRQKWQVMPARAHTCGEEAAAARAAVSGGAVTPRARACRLRVDACRHCRHAAARRGRPHAALPHLPRCRTRSHGRRCCSAAPGTPPASPLAARRYRRRLQKGAGRRQGGLGGCARADGRRSRQAARSPDPTVTFCRAPTRAATRTCEDVVEPGRLVVVIGDGLLVAQLLKLGARAGEAPRPPHRLAAHLLAPLLRAISGGRVRRGPGRAAGAREGLAARHAPWGRA